MTQDTDQDTLKRVEKRLRDDLRLGHDDVDGIMTILDEELAPLDHVLDDWACDECGENKATATKGLGGPELCNECIFGEREAE